MKNTQAFGVLVVGVVVHGSGLKAYDLGSTVCFSFIFQRPQEEALFKRGGFRLGQRQMLLDTCTTSSQ